MCSALILTKWSVFFYFFFKPNKANQDNIWSLCFIWKDYNVGYEFIYLDLVKVVKFNES